MDSEQLKPGFLWWRAPAYEIQRDVVMPSHPPEPFVLSSGSEPWKELKRLHGAYRGEPLSATAKTEICAWCKRYGLPGYLLQTTEQVCLPARSQSLGHALTKKTATSFRRVAGRWVTEQITIGDDTGGYARPGEYAGLLERADFTKRSQPHVVSDRFMEFIIERDRAASWLASEEADRQERESIRRLAAQLGCAVDNCPQPGTQEFFNVYREPIVDFFRAARLLAWMETACAAAADDTLALLNQFEGLGFVVAPNTQIAWTGPSLLAAFAVERLTRGRDMRRCEFSGCATPFLPDRTDQRYCQDTCRYADAKQRDRAAKKSPKI